MKILVTSGAGFIGSHTVDRLLERGYEVHILDALTEPVHRGRKKSDYLPAETEDGGRIFADTPCMQHLRSLEFDYAQNLILFRHLYLYVPQ